MLMRRKECVRDLPYAILVLRIANFMYHVFVPPSVRDLAIHEKTLGLPPFPTLPLHQVCFESSNDIMRVIPMYMSQLFLGAERTDAPKGS